mmetsp:Transcript_39618/g.99594  ORF Transcript_39618/g.99594 Transcript_39618/m.99594 type:complete len:245 (-) Transcript_39618:483-1217(-)
MKGNSHSDIHVNERTHGSPLATGGHCQHRLPCHCYHVELAAAPASVDPPPSFLPLPNSARQRVAISSCAMCSSAPTATRSATSASPTMASQPRGPRLRRMARWERARWRIARFMRFCSFSRSDIFTRAAGGIRLISKSSSTLSSSRERSAVARARAPSRRMRRPLVGDVSVREMATMLASRATRRSCRPSELPSKAVSVSALDDGCAPVGALFTPAFLLGAIAGAFPVPLGSFSVSCCSSTCVM